MGAAAVMHPCGPHFNNWTDIGAAPAGSLNHCRGFEQTAVTLRDQARPKKTQTEGKKEEKKKKEEEEKKGCIQGGEHGLGLQSNEHISVEAPQIRYLKIVSCLNKS